MLFTESGWVDINRGEVEFYGIKKYDLNLRRSIIGQWFDGSVIYGVNKLIDICLEDDCGRNENDVIDVWLYQE